MENDEFMAATTAQEPIAETTIEPVENLETTQAPKESIEDTLRAAYDKMHPQRDAQGKFLAKQKQDEVTPEPVEAEAPPEVATTTKEMPNSWAKDALEKWNSLPPDVQDIILKREEDANRGVQKLKEQYSQLEELDKVFKPYDGYFRSKGVNATQAAQQLIAANDFLERDPVAAIHWLAKQYNVDLSSQATAPQGGEQQAYNPDVASLKAEIYQLKQALTYDQAQREAETLKSYEAEVEKFKADEAHKHFDDLRFDMAKLITSGIAQDLKDAYDKALYLNPQIREKVFSEQKAQEEARRLEEIKRKTSQAKRASTINVRSTPAGQSPKTVDDTLKETAMRLYS